MHYTNITLPNSINQETNTHYCKGTRGLQRPTPNELVTQCFVTEVPLSLRQHSRHRCYHAFPAQKVFQPLPLEMKRSPELANQEICLATCERRAKLFLPHPGTKDLVHKYHTVCHHLNYQNVILLPVMGIYLPSLLEHSNYSNFRGCLKAFKGQKLLSVTNKEFFRSTKHFW